MRFSVSLRIFIGFAVVVACFGAASLYSVASVTSLRHELHFLRKRALPLLESLRRSGVELRGFDEALQRAAPHDLDWVARFVPGAKPYDRIDRVRKQVKLLEASSQPPRLARFAFSDVPPLPSVNADLARARHATEARDRIAADTLLLPLLPNHKLVATDDAQTFDTLVLALRATVAERRYSEAARLVVELRRLIRSVHTALGRSERVLEQALNERFAAAARSEARLSLVVVASVGVALGVSIIALLVMLATLRPVSQLAEIVRRFARGEREVRASTDGAAEIHELAVEWNRMADALAEREALLAGQRDELSRADRLATLGQLAARMAHEIRNPLSSIGLNAEMLEEDLRRDDFDRAEASELLESIGEEVEHLRGVTETYLARARRAPEEHVRTDLGELLGRIVDFARGELEQRKVRCVVHAAPGMEADIDERMVRSAVWNLLRNALEAMPEGGTLWLEVHRVAPESLEDDEQAPSAPMLVLAVEDSGAGVAEEVRDRVFEPFFTTKERGTGVGLALVVEAARAHHGRVQLAPPQHGSGARFQLTIPASSSGRGSLPTETL